jgi:glutathione S-transferase
MMGDNLKSAYKKLNPMAKVPCIKDGDFVLFESNSILRYLARSRNKENFYPLSPIDAAKVD